MLGSWTSDLTKLNKQVLNGNKYKLLGHLLTVTTPISWMTFGCLNWPMMEASEMKSSLVLEVAPCWWNQRNKYFRERKVFQSKAMAKTLRPKQSLDSRSKYCKIRARDKLNRYWLWARKHSRNQFSDSRNSVSSLLETNRKCHKHQNQNKSNYNNNRHIRIPLGFLLQR